MTNHTLTTNQSQREKFISQYKPLAQNGKAIASSTRNKAIEALETLEIPTKKWEAWKYTNLKEITTQDYALSADASITDISQYLIPELEADVLVFVNGTYNEALSSLKLNEGVLTVSRITNLSSEETALFEENLSSLIDADADIFTALNTAFVHEGVFIRVGRGKNAEAPIHIIHLSTPGENALATQFRNLFLVEDGGNAKVIESQFTVGEGTTFSNSVTEIKIGNNAGFEYIKLQLESDQASQVNTTMVNQGNDSRSKIFTITMSGDTVRNNLKMMLDGQNIEAELMGINLLSGYQHVDNHTEVHHLKPHCYSNELYKGIMSEKSTGVFNGKIHVYEDAQKTNAFQSNRNILLSDTANIFTKPQLEIYADDVKCSHGATTGRLDEDAMFYLRARGIKEYDARIMLIYAFAMEVADNISIEAVQNYISSLIQNRF